MTEEEMIKNLYLPKSVVKAHDAESIRKWVFPFFFVFYILLASHWQITHENMTAIRSENTLAIIFLSGMCMIASARSWWRWHHFKDEENLINGKIFLFESVFGVWPPEPYTKDVTEVQEAVTDNFAMMGLGLTLDRLRLDATRGFEVKYSLPSTYHAKEIEKLESAIQDRVRHLRKAIAVAEDWNFVVSDVVRDLIK